MAAESKERKKRKRDEETLKDLGDFLENPKRRKPPPRIAAQYMSDPYKPGEVSTVAPFAWPVAEVYGQTTPSAIWDGTSLPRHFHWQEEHFSALPFDPHNREQWRAWERGITREELDRMKRERRNARRRAIIDAWRNRGSMQQVWVPGDNPPPLPRTQPVSYTHLTLPTIYSV